MTYEKLQKIALLYRIFQIEEWTWCSLHSPSYKEMVEAINDLEESAYKCKGTAESGRIRVEYDKKIDDYNYYLVL